MNIYKESFVDVRNTFYPRSVGRIYPDNVDIIVFWNKCNCVEMVDIGIYNSCPYFCKYYYAKFNEEKVKDNFKLHNDNSSLLVGHITKGDVTNVRR